MAKDLDTTLAEIDEIMKKFKIEPQQETPVTEPDEVHILSLEEIEAGLNDLNLCMPDKPESEEEPASAELEDYDFEAAFAKLFGNAGELPAEEKTTGLPIDTDGTAAGESIQPSEQELQVVIKEQPGNPTKKRMRFPIGNFLFYGVLIAIVLAVYFSNSAGGNKPHTLFGYSIFSVLTGSMRSEIPEGSLVITKYTDPNQIKAGDDITYLREDLSTVTHRVVEIYENYNESGVRGFRTKGIDNPMADTNIVHPDNILGVVIFHVAGVGAFFAYVRQNPLLIVLIGAILIALVYTLRYIRRNRKNRPKKPKPTMV